MSSCCDRALGALIASGGVAAGGDPTHEVIYRQRIARLRQQLWQFRHDQQDRPRGTIWLIRHPWRRSK